MCLYVHVCACVFVRMCAFCARQELVLLSRSCACGVSDGIAAAHLVVAGVGTAAAKAVVIVAAGVQLRWQASRPAAGGTRLVGLLLWSVFLAAQLGSAEVLRYVL